MTDDGYDAYVSTVAACVALPIRPQDRREVVANLRLILEQSAALMVLPIDDADEIAPVFRA